MAISNSGGPGGRAELAAIQEALPSILARVYKDRHEYTGTKPPTLNRFQRVADFFFPLRGRAARGKHTPDYLPVHFQCHSTPRTSTRKTYFGVRLARTLARTCSRPQIQNYPGILLHTDAIRVAALCWQHHIAETVLFQPNSLAITPALSLLSLMTNDIRTRLENNMRMQQFASAVDPAEIFNSFLKHLDPALMTTASFEYQILDAELGLLNACLDPDCVSDVSKQLAEQSTPLFAVLIRLLRKGFAISKPKYPNTHWKTMAIAGSSVVGSLAPL